MLNKTGRLCGKSILAFIFTSSTVVPCLAQGDACDVGLINALKTNFHIKDTHVLSDAVYDAACNSSSHAAGGSYGAISFNYNDASNACQKHDEKYFEQYDRDLAYSFLPPEAWSTIRDVCNRNPVELSVSVNENALIVKAQFHPVGNLTHATVRSFAYTTNSAGCKTKTIRPGVVLGNGPITEICQRKSEEPVTFIVNTDQGGQFAALTAIQPEPYSLIIGPVDDYMGCTLNGSLVASRKFGDPNEVRVVLTGLHPGPNTLQCTVRDDHPCGDGQACWSYVFAVLHGGAVIGGGSDGAHGRGTVQPPPVIIDYTDPHSLPKANKKSVN